MEWLNTSVTFLNSPEFRRSKTEQRGVWLTLMGYCVQQENGGRITGTDTWGDWDWQMVLGVSEKAVHEECTLWHWDDGPVLILHGYPLEKQEEVRAKRRAGRKGGLRSGEARAKHSFNTASSTATRTPSTEEERKGNRKGRGKERKQGAGAPMVAPSVEVWLAHVQASHPEWPELDARSAWSHYEAAGWVLRRGKPVRSWQACVETCYARWAGGAKKTSTGGRVEAPFDSSRPHAHTGGLEIFEAAAPATEVAP